LSRLVRHERREHPILWWLVVGIGFILILPFVLTFWALRAIWRSTYASSVKWGLTGAIAVVWLVIVIGASAANNGQTNGVQTASASPATQVAAALTPTSTLPPSPMPTPIPVAPKATQAPPPAATQPPIPRVVNTCGAPQNPWGYNFCGGNFITAPPPNFCSYFACIPSFWNQTKGYVDECLDGKYSHSGGRQGACSYHGGESRPLYGS
jgi:hypothetical protein